MYTQQKPQFAQCDLGSKLCIHIDRRRYPIGPFHYQAVTHLNLLFLSLCGMEVTIKFIGLGPNAFFKDGWLISDLTLVSTSVFLRLSGAQSGIEALRVMRVFRIIVLGAFTHIKIKIKILLSRKSRDSSVEKV